MRLLTVLASGLVLTAAAEAREGGTPDAKEPTAPFAIAEGTLQPGGAPLPSRRERAHARPISHADRRAALPVLRSARSRSLPLRAGAPGSDAACSATVTLTPGVPYNGDTTGQANKFSGTAYPGLGWGEYGPDVVHRITLTQAADLRIFIAPDAVTDPDLDVILLDGTGGSCDTVNWFWAGDFAIVAPDLPAGTYYVIVDGYTASDYGRYTLTVAAARGLLLVDDDGSGDSTQCSGGCPDVQPKWVNAVRGMANPPDWSVWEVRSMGSPDVVTLGNSKMVIWFCGASWNSGKTVTPSDQENLKDYLDLGGRLLLAGQDILWDVKGGADGRLPDGSLFASYMQVTDVSHDVWTSATSAFTIDGVVGNPVSDVLNCNDSALYFDQFTTGMGAPFTAYADSLGTHFGEPVYYNNYLAADGSSQRPSAIRYETTLGAGDYYKTMFLAFAPECDDPAWVAPDMTALLEGTLAWLDEDGSTLCSGDLDVSASLDDSATGNGNGIPDPAEQFYLRVTVTNTDTVSHAVKIYLAFEDYYVTRYTPLCVSLGTIAAGGSAQGSFLMRMVSTTPIGYRVRPEVNVVLADSGEAFCFRQGFGVFVGQADVMLVKDESMLPQTTGVDTYTQILASLGYRTALWDANLFGAPTYDGLWLRNDRMRYYDFVVWLTGFDYADTLTPTPYEQSLGINPEAEIASYLDLRVTQEGEAARLLISSQDYLYDRYAGQSGSIPSADFARTHLKVQSVQQDHARDDTVTLFGVPGVYAADLMQMGLVNGQVFTNYGDRIEIDPAEAGTSALFTYQVDPQLLPAGVLNVQKSRGSRFAFLPFALENLQDQAPGAFNGKQRFLERLLCQMRMISSDVVPPCGYFTPRNLPAFQSLRALKTGGTSLDMTWGAVTFRNQRWDAALGNYEPITGIYRVRRGPCASLSTGPFDLPIVNRVSDPFHTDSAAPSPSGDCYNVIDYEDVFGQQGTLNQ